MSKPLDPEPWVWPDSLRNFKGLFPGELRSIFPTGDGQALTFNPRPEYEQDRSKC